MSWELLLALVALLAFVVQLLYFLRADGDLTLLWAEWQGRRPEQELTNKVIWVTGASSGIGEELAYQLSKLDVSLVLSARRVHELERVKRKCLENGNLKGKDILVLPLDLKDMSSHEAATKAVVKEFGKIDILVNNSGRSHCSWCLETSMDIYRELIELNYLGTISLTKCVLPHMVKRKQGKIITVTSILGHVSMPVSSAYCASKHALRGFLNSLRIELATYPGIVVSNICPGPVQSNIMKNSLTKDVTTILGHNGDQYRQMVTSRCVWLILISMANDLKEVWIAEQPFLLMLYLCQYMPTWSSWVINKVRKRIENFNNSVGSRTIAALSFVIIFVLVQILYTDDFRIWKKKRD
ncbi:dehydrogenase/reductase SDR family member 7 isoform X1 [Pteropus vampyrus]|uniref:Dehydrogenase/reductase SDR family member 7 isoform X1 n=2 Tax=Pteropus vampyrus TaxID=132908 RepID=A0A6P6C6F9_PTEVA|nr:dehydrogenase/reductase SDR family member 7 isoform X1 [Pteropus vampyrus]